MNTHRLTLLALLAALGVVGRAFFVFMPNVQPVTSLLIICGLVLGPGSAIALALLVTFLSNMILGMGIWTVWQMISWGLIGVISGILGKIFLRIPLSLVALYAAFCGYFYGFIISLTTYQITGKFWPYYLAGLPFDTNHAIGNVVFIVLLYPMITFLLKKYDQSNLQTKDIN